MRKKILTSGSLIICIAVSVMGGCVPSPPESAGEELTRHHWELPQPSGARSCTLDFAQDRLTLTASGFGEDVNLTGECLVGDGTVTVLSEDFGTVSFDYELDGEKLLLRYCGRCMTLVKGDAP